VKGGSRNRDISVSGLMEDFELVTLIKDGDSDI